MKLSFNVSDILSSLLKIGAALTEKQLETLKWRLSDDAAQYYTQEQTNDFYKALRKGKTEVIDIARKEQQDIIDKLKLDIRLQ